MHIDNDNSGMLSMLFQNRVDTPERVVDVVRHENSSLKVNDQGLQPVCALPFAPAPSGRAGRKIGRSKQRSSILQIRIDLFLLPNVISARQHVNARSEKLAGALDVDTHAAGGILRVCDGKVDLLFLD